MSFGSTYSASLKGLPKDQIKSLKEITKHYNGIIPRSNEGHIRLSVDIGDDGYIEEILTKAKVSAAKKVEHHDVSRVMIDKVLETGILGKVKKEIMSKTFSHLIPSSAK